MEKEEYLFYEWIILEKGISKEEFEKMPNWKFWKLKKEYAEFCKNLRP